MGVGTFFEAVGTLNGKVPTRYQRGGTNVSPLPVWKKARKAYFHQCAHTLTANLPSSLPHLANAHHATARLLLMPFSIEHATSAVVIAEYQFGMRDGTGDLSPTPAGMVLVSFFSVCGRGQSWRVSPSFF